MRLQGGQGIKVTEQAAQVIEPGLALLLGSLSSKCRRHLWPSGGQEAMERTLGPRLLSLLHSLEFEVPCHTLCSGGSNSESLRDTPCHQYLSIQLYKGLKTDLLKSRWRNWPRERMEVGRMPLCSLKYFPAAPIGYHNATRLSTHRTFQKGTGIVLSLLLRKLFLLPRRLPESPGGAFQHVLHVALSRCYYRVSHHYRP